jgi:hypothetical protein
MSGIPYVSNRFALERFLGMSKEEIAENERLWREENDETLGQQSSDAAGEMRTAGISGAGLGADLGGIEDELPGEEAPIDGGASEAPTTTTGQEIGGGAPGGEQTI